MEWVVNPSRYCWDWKEGRNARSWTLSAFYAGAGLSTSYLCRDIASISPCYLLKSDDDVGRDGTYEGHSELKLSEDIGKVSGSSTVFDMMIFIRPQTLRCTFDRRYFR